jgi:hypothetical protein
MLNRFNTTKIFLLLCVTLALLLLANNMILLTDDIYYEAFNDQLSFEKIRETIDLNKKWNWVIYPSIPLIYFLKFSILSICLSVGAFLFNYEINFKSFFKIVLLADFILLLPPLIKLLWFSLVDINYTLNDLQFFTPLSAINFFDGSTLEPWLVYPLSLLNLFEVGYIIALAYLMREVIESDFAQSLKLVLVSYGTGLLIWVIFITFLTVSLSA